MIDYMLFTGPTKETNVDHKGRINLPASLKEIIRSHEQTYDQFKGAIYLFPDDSGNFFSCYTPLVYVMSAEKFLERAENDADRLAYFSAERKSMDKQGRIIVPELYKGIEKVILVPNGDHFQLRKPANQTE